MSVPLIRTNPETIWFPQKVAKAIIFAGDSLLYQIIARITGFGQGK